MKKYILLASLLFLQTPCFAAQPTTLDLHELSEALQKLSHEELCELAQSVEEKSAHILTPERVWVALAIALILFYELYETCNDYTPGTLPRFLRLFCKERTIL
ncbi:hypothetical protein K2W90_00175 [Candidatus Babeliales bacterium]|nr:hypothetical protein [Candidatus Babeliales bacterium]